MVNNYIKKSMLKKLSDHLKEYCDKDLYTICTSYYFLNKFYQMKKAKGMKKIFKESVKCDKKLPLSRKVGKELEELFEQKDVVIGIYTTQFDNNELQSSKISKIMNEGINVNYKTYSIPDLKGNIYFFENYLEAMYNLKNDCIHENVDFILKFPKSLVNEEGEYLDSSFNSLFNVNKEGVFVKPEYIDSYVVSKHDFMNRISKKEITKTLIKK